jgi:replicative DNA helicase
MSTMFPPFDPAAEKCVIGCCLLDNDAIPIVADALLAEDFYIEAHADLWLAILRLHRAGRGVDAITLADALIKAGRFDDLGGDDLLTDVVHSVRGLDDVARIRDAIGIVRELSDHRIGGAS